MEERGKYNGTAHLKKNEENNRNYIEESKILMIYGEESPNVAEIALLEKVKKFCCPTGLLTHMMTCSEEINKEDKNQLETTALNIAKGLKFIEKRLEKLNTPQINNEANN